ncbi:MAG: hypothetical protein ACRECZ_06195, partial [Methylocella sp.]
MSATKLESAGVVITANSEPAKQAIVVIHGIGEQMPMDTIKRFVKAVWTTDTAIHHEDKDKDKEGEEDKANVWSSPDARTD